MYASRETAWCSCSGCGVEAELPAEETAGVEVPCPDCAGPMSELWSWESAAA
ncbi:hypothetical protein [Pseudonocardia sp. KRD291]|uniref:hypothetical protein n=1 Tax=Pseudonocardia sp. KRD291 TaxID=2792007 RepID=UPI001C4A44C1|nr:hypothetical protein [Pseudonocardia sp. KRD291]MBW0105589.1 hypothetical protein [Pseudonocardia sp. KRD291]